MAWYREGTASIANGATTVTGTLTAWTAQAKTGDRITFDGGGTWYEVLSVESNTSLTLGSAFGEATVTDGAYAIDRSGPAWGLVSGLAASVAALLALFPPLTGMGDAGKWFRANDTGTAFETTAAAPATITIGTVTTGDPGTPVSVTNSGTATDALLDFEIPRGADGASGITDAEFTATGLMTRTASNTFAARTLTGGTGIDVAEGAGVGGNPSIALSGASQASLALADSAVQPGDVTDMLVDGDIGTTVQAHSAQLDTAAAGTIRLAGKETIWLPAAAMLPRTTDGAAPGTTESATNKVMLRSLDFDSSTEEGAGFWLALPKSWDEGTISFKPFWSATSGAGAVVWGLSAIAISDNEAIDTAPGGQQTSTDTLLNTGRVHVGPESAAITISGSPAEGDMVYFEVTREVAAGGDTLTGDAQLIGLQVFFTTNSANDA